MVPALYNPISILIEDRDPSKQSINLGRMGLLYILAATFQCVWPILILINWETAVRVMDLPGLGWVFIIIWTAMLWLIPHLAFIGFRLLKIGRDPAFVVHQTHEERQKMRLIATLLVLGVLIDILLVPYLLTMKGTGWIIFASALLGGRTVQANMEAVLQYHRR